MTENVYAAFCDILLLKWQCTGTSSFQLDLGWKANTIHDILPTVSIGDK